MVIGPQSVLGAILHGLGVNVLIKTAIVGLVAPIAIRMLLEQKAEKQRLLWATLVMAVGGSLGFQVFLWLPLGFVGLVPGFVAFWVIVSCTLDHYFDVHYEESYAYTGQIVGISVLLWLIVGVAIYFLSGHAGAPR